MCDALQSPGVFSQHKRCKAGRKLFVVTTERVRAACSGERCVTVLGDYLDIIHWLFIVMNTASDLALFVFPGLIATGGCAV